MKNPSLMFRCLFILAVLFSLSHTAHAALEPVENFAKATLIQGYGVGSTTIVATTGQGARFPSTFPYRVTWYACSAYPAAVDDPNREIVLVTNRSSDTFTITRAQENTIASPHDTAATEYCIEQTLTKAMWLSIQDAITEGAGGAQDILNIVAADLQASLASAVSVAGSTKALRITDNQTAAVDTNFSSLPAVWIPCPGKLSWSDSKFMDFDRPEQIVAGDCQIFDAKVGVRFAKPGKVNPRWWGGGSAKTDTVNKTAMDLAIASLPTGSNTTSIIEISGGMYQVNNTISSDSKNIRIQCLDDSGFILTASGSNKHLFQATGTTSRWKIDHCHLKTSSTIVTDIGMKAFAMDVGNAVSSAPAGSIFEFTHNIVEGFNIGSNCDGGSSLVIEVCLDEYNSYKTGGSGGAAVNEGSLHMRSVHMYIKSNIYDGQSKGEHCIYAIHPIHAQISGNTCTGYQWEAIKVLTYPSASGLTNPRNWEIRHNTLKDNQGSVVIETNQNYVLQQVSLDHTTIDGDSAVGSNESAIMIQALGTSHLRLLTANGVQISNAAKCGIILNTSTTATISRAELHALQMFNWSTASVGLYAAIYSSNANGTKRSISVSGQFDGNSNGRNIFGVDFDTYWDDVQAFDVQSNDISLPDITRPHVKVGGSSSVAQMGGTHYSKTTTTGTPANTVEATLDTVTIKGGSFTSNKNGFHIKMFGTFAANANTKTLRIKVGSTTVISNDKTTAPNGTAWSVDLWIMYTGTDTQVVQATMQIDCVNQTPTVTATTIDEDVDNTITATGQNGTSSADDIRHNVTVSQYIS